MGLVKPPMGLMCYYYGVMNRSPKRPKFVAMEVREAIAWNVRRRMDLVFANQSNKVMALSKRIGTSKSTVQRVLDADVGVTVDVLAQLAMGLGCCPADLLEPPSR